MCSRKSRLGLRQKENHDWKALFWLSEAYILGADSWMEQTVNTHRPWRMWVAAGPTSTFLQKLKMQEAELGLKGAPLSHHNSNAFLHHPGSEK